jgi:methionine synthase II (cobalamin-independent)
MTSPVPELSSIALPSPRQQASCAGHRHLQASGAREQDSLKRRIDEAAKFAPLEQICLSPQCGFASTVEGNAISIEEQFQKLRLVVETAREIWRDA